MWEEETNSRRNSRCDITLLIQRWFWKLLRRRLQIRRYISSSRHLALCITSELFSEEWWPVKVNSNASRYIWCLKQQALKERCGSSRPDAGPARVHFSSTKSSDLLALKSSGYRCCCGQLFLRHTLHNIHDLPPQQTSLLSLILDLLLSIFCRYLYEKR